MKATEDPISDARGWGGDAQPSPSTSVARGWRARRRAGQRPAPQCWLNPISCGAAVSAARGKFVMRERRRGTVDFTDPRRTAFAPLRGRGELPHLDAYPLPRAYRPCDQDRPLSRSHLTVAKQASHLPQSYESRAPSPESHSEPRAPVVARSKRNPSQERRASAP